MASSSSSSQPFFVFLRENPIAEQEEQSSQNAPPPMVVAANPLPSQRMRIRLQTPIYRGVEIEVVALTREALLETEKFHCEICDKGFQREQNLELHRRSHNQEWRLKRRSGNKDGLPRPRKVYVCPETTCVHNDPDKALGDLTGIKKHFSRKHGDPNRYRCKKCARPYAVYADVKAHQKTCVTITCACGVNFKRRDSLETHLSMCNKFLGSERHESSSSIAKTIPKSVTNTSGDIFVNTSGRILSTSKKTSDNIPPSPLNTSGDISITSQNTSANVHASYLNISDKMRAYSSNTDKKRSFDDYQSQPSNKDGNDYYFNMNDIFSMSEDHPMMSSSNIIDNKGKEPLQRRMHVFNVDNNMSIFSEDDNDTRMLGGEGTDVLEMKGFEGLKSDSYDSSNRPFVSAMTLLEMTAKIAPPWGNTSFKRYGESNLSNGGEGCLSSSTFFGFDIVQDLRGAEKSVDE